MNARFIPSICSYCGTGCGVVYQAVGDRVLASLPNPASRVNRGRLCIKGWSIHEHLRAPGRLTTPLTLRDGVLSPASWEDALGMTVGALRRIVETHGPDSVAVLSSARITNEENYLAQKFARTILKTNNVDHCARLCHSASVSGLAATLGSGAMTNSMEDIEEARCIFIIGSNTTECHPLFASRIMRAKAKGAAILVADPRPTQLSVMADLHLLVNPGADIALLNAMAGVILREGLQDPAVAEKTEDYEIFRDFALSCDVESAAALVGVSSADIEAAARMYAAGPAAICYAMGITQYSSGTARVYACANLALLRGNIGIPGGGINPLRGQNNVQGACDMGALPDSYPGYRKVTDENARKDMERAWGCDLPDKPGLHLTKIPEAILEGKIRALYVIGENPLVSDPDTRHLTQAIKRLEFLAVQDIFLTSTGKLAHVVLPAAAAPEKDGTFTSTERRCSRLHKAVPPPGQAISDGEILCRLAKAMGGGWVWNGAEDVFNEMRTVVPSYAGMTYRRLGIQGLQWPCPDEGHPGTPILHVNGCARGKGRFIPPRQGQPAEPVDQQYPFILSTGRNFAHYHTATMSGVSPTLAREGGEVYVEMHPEDAASVGAGQGAVVRLSTRRGEICARVRLVAGISRGTVFVPFHYVDNPANALTLNNTDPVCGIPEFKYCAVKIEHDRTA
ncbi:MAG: formate dehydrogenase subunit alpha [Desulfovibrio sp.]|jgi:formate dehydrogenase alpha subunit|nr:formate dehydrogenase subunit alpha [Desulfovibrio sp.]